MGSFLSSIAITLPFTALVVYQTDFDLYGVAVANILGAMFAALVTLSYWRSHSHAIEASSNENITSSNIRAKDKFQSIFFRERIQYGVLFNNSTYNQIELPLSSDELAREEHQLLM
jgi:glycerol uptake facilitator-like aquaporin